MVEITRKYPHGNSNKCEILKAIRQDFMENNKEEIFIKALNDGINYTAQRLDKYKTTDWIMTIN